MNKEDRDKRISQASQAALNMSHGVKNILQAVKGGGEVMDQALKDGDIEKARRGWKILKQNLERINRLVLDMLAYTKESELKPGDCDLGALVESAVATIRADAEDQNIALSVETVPLRVNIDGDRIYDVVLNLLLNALYAVSPGREAISISAGLRDGCAVITVSDNGPGIKDIGTVFEPFHTTKARVGAGLGLAISKKIVEQHNGSIEFKSAPGNGTSFIVTLPVE